MDKYAKISQKIQEKAGFKNVKLASHNPVDLDGQPDVDLFYLQFEGEKDGEKYSLKVTSKAKEEIVGSLTYLDLLNNQLQVYRSIGRQIPENLSCYLWPTLEVIEVADNISLVVMPYFYGKGFLGEQCNRKVNQDEVKKWFKPLAECLNYFDGLIQSDYPVFPRNFKAVDSEKEKKSQQFKKQREEFNKFGLDLGLFDKMFELWDNLDLEVAFQKYDLTPWWAITHNSKYALLNYHWAGFRDRYYDVAYLFIKLWIHVHEPELAKEWLKTFQQNLSGKPREHFESQLFKPLAERIVVDLLEYKDDPRHLDIVKLAERIAIGKFVELIR